MVVTVVLRLLPGPLESGELVGHAELVASGVSEPVKSTQDVIAFARKVVADRVDTPTPDLATAAEELP